MKKNTVQSKLINIPAVSCAAILTLAVMLPGSVAQTPLQNRTYIVPRTELEETKKMFESILSPEGKVYVLRSQGKILVQDTTDGIRRADELYRVITAPAPNVRVEFFSNEISSGGDFGLEPQVEVRGKRIRVGAYVIDQMSSGSSLSSQFLLVRNGGTASMEIGRWVPVPTYFYRLCYGLGLIPAEVEYKFIGRALQITPQIQGNLIDLEIVPVLTALVDGKTTTIELRTLSSRVTVQNGATFQLGGFDSADDEFNRNFFALERGRRNKSGSFTVRATIEAPQILQRDTSRLREQF
jgi:hypothetical protein